MVSSSSEVTLSNLTEDLRLDAEFYQPHYVYESQRISALPHKRLDDLALITDGNHLAISEKFCSEGARYLRGQDLKEFFISDADPVFIPEAEYKKLSRSHMFPGDVLVGIVGTIGSVGLVTDRFRELTGNCKLAIIRPYELESEYIAVFLASQIGHNGISRRIRGTVQMGLILPDLRELPIPLLDQGFRKNIAQLVRESLKARDESTKLYGIAGLVFLKELGASSFKPTDTLSYERRFSETVTYGRLDAEFYRPKYLSVLRIIERTKPTSITPLGNFLSLITNGHTPLHHDLSVGEIPFLTAEHVYDFKVNYASEKRILREHHYGELKRTQLKEGDLLITIKGRIGNAAIVESLEGPANINQDVALLRIHDGLPPHFLLSFLNSPAGKALSERYSTGQINPFLGLGNLKLLPIPLYERKVMERIARSTAEVVAKAREAEEESRFLLEKARRMVEDAVSRGA